MTLEESLKLETELGRKVNVLKTLLKAARLLWRRESLSIYIRRINQHQKQVLLNKINKRKVNYGSGFKGKSCYRNRN
jgi:hypothetical protein